MCLVRFRIIEFACSHCQFPQESFEACDKQDTDECFTQTHDYIEPPHKVPERCPICVEFEEGLKKGINGFGEPDRLGGGVR